MGNTTSNRTTQEGSNDGSHLGDRSFKGTGREEDKHDYHLRHTLSGHYQGTGPQASPSHHKTKRIERSRSMLDRPIQSSEAFHVSGHNDPMSKDDLGTHVESAEPRGITNVASTIVVQFDIDVKTICEDKIFEVFCISYEPPVSVRGRTVHNANSNRVEFIPHHSLQPKCKYEVKVNGHSVTTTQCSNPRNIMSYLWSFETNVPTAKTLKVKLKDEQSLINFTITEEMYSNLFYSLLEWGVRRFGISGEYIKEISTTDQNGFHLVVHSDRDVLGIKEDQPIVFDIRD